MANWKKVLVSGSNIEVNHITASAGVQLQSLLSNTENLSVLTVDGSGNVTARTATVFINIPVGAPILQTNNLGVHLFYSLTINAI